MTILDAQEAFRSAYERRHWFKVGQLPALPSMTPEQAEQARDDAWNAYCFSWRPIAREIYLAERDAINAAERVAA